MCKMIKAPLPRRPAASGESPSASGAAKQKASQLALRSINRTRGGGSGDPPGRACGVAVVKTHFRAVHLPKYRLVASTIWASSKVAAENLADVHVYDPLEFAWEESFGEESSFFHLRPLNLTWKPRMDMINRKIIFQPKVVGFPSLNLRAVNLLKGGDWLCGFRPCSASTGSMRSTSKPRSWRSSPATRRIWKLCTLGC